MEDFKIEEEETGRAVKQWKKDTKAWYSDSANEKRRLTAAVSKRPMGI